MTIKEILPVVLSLCLAESSWSGLISLPEEHDHHHVSVASSYMHFHGPVEGPEFQIKVPHVLSHHSEHNLLGHEHENHHIGYTYDYVAHPKYEFSYGVEDHHTGDFHGQKEIRDGDGVHGLYSVAEPGGTVRIVTYRADKDGFHAVVQTTGKNDHSGATYTPQSQQLHLPTHDAHHYALSPHEDLA